MKSKTAQEKELKIESEIAVNVARLIYEKACAVSEKFYDGEAIYLGSLRDICLSQDPEAKQEPPQDKGIDERAEADIEVERVYKESWQEIIEPNSIIDLVQLKKELYDFTCLMDRFQKVVNIFGGTMGISNLTYTDDVYAQALNEYVEQAVNDAKQEVSASQLEDAFNAGFAACLAWDEKAATRPTFQQFIESKKQEGKV